MTDVPTIETDRLILRGWREADIATVNAIATDEETARFIGGTTPPWQSFRTVASFIGHWALRGFGFFAVERRDTGTCIGWAGPWRPDGWPDNEIGYSLDKHHWGRGFGTEAARESLRFAYERCGWTTAISLIDEGNTGSEAIARKLGARIETRDAAVNDFRCNIWRHLPPAEFMERAA